jgi:diketogulonate reductase-like aldo/keto reductase
VCFLREDAKAKYHQRQNAKGLDKGLMTVALVVLAWGSVPTLEIAPGVEMPMLGLGTGPPFSADDTYTATLNALQKYGYSAIDTAHNYKNQPAIARAIRDSGIAREKVFITSKVPGSLTYQETLDTNELSLTELNTTYVDLMLVHFPCPSQPYNESKGSKQLRQAQWKAMEAFHHAGKARAIGESIYTYYQTIAATGGH